jgi:hypothetical protein
MNEPLSKIYFRGIWYPIITIRNALCMAHQVDDLPDEVKDSDLEEIIDATVKGSPTAFARFQTYLNESDLK